MTYTLPLQDVDRSQIDLVGGKAAHLGEMAGNGIEVPPAFVITTRAFRDQFAGHPILSSANSVDDTSLKSLRRTPVRADIAHSIDDAFNRLSISNNLFVVRSSATNEDGVSHSHAGQHATYYYIRRENLLSAVMNCWLSLFHHHAQVYRNLSGDDAIPEMAIIVQAMVPAEVSGVSFTRDPTGKFSEELIIEATWGLGATLVDGRVTPDQFRLLREGLKPSSRRIARKSCKVAEDLIDHESTRLEPVPTHLQRAATLDSAQLNRIARIAMACEAHFGQPQDVEWAMSGDTIYLLQSRPITGIAEPARTEIPGRWVAFKPILENFTEPLTPLTIDLFRSVLGPVGAFIDGRYYLNFNLLSRLIPLDTSDAEQVKLALFQTSPENYRLKPVKVLMLMLFAFPTYLTVGSLLVRTRRLSDKMLAGFGTLCDRVRRSPEVSPLDALKTLFLGRHPYAPIWDFMFLINLSSVRYFFLLPLLYWWLKRYVPGLDPNLVPRLCAGNDEMKSTELIEDLKQLAQIAESTPAVAEVLLHAPAPEVIQKLAQTEEAKVFNAAFQEFLETYGHRATREVEFASPRWREDPTPLISMLANFLQDSSSGKENGHWQKSLAEGYAALGSAAPNIVHRKWIEWLISRIRYYATLRENTRFYHTLVMDVVRQKILDIEQKLIQQGRLKCPDDIFYLTSEEIDALQQGHLSWREVEGRLQVRRLKQLKLTRSQPPLAINLPVPTTNRSPNSSHKLYGQCACPGVVEGIARIIRDPGSDARIKPGEILVAPYTDPAWTPLFPVAMAVVVEVGSYLSHAGTVAREFDIPCVVDVEGCVEGIRNGQRLRVNATDGVIELLQDAPS